LREGLGFEVGEIWKGLELGKEMQMVQRLGDGRREKE
tara:strand:- start:2292 stop:2402 length:111 start_codon:yes stop_codon:yes gene_type:complete